MPLLAASGDAELRGVAQRDLAGAKEAAAQIALGDAWWDMADKRGAKAGQIRVRAAYWYRQAEPGLAGLALVKVESRIKDIRSDRGPCRG